MQIVVQLKPAAAHRLHRTGAVIVGVVLHPMHPGTNDPGLMQFFTAEAPDRISAKTLIDRLRQDAAVEAAYIKPSDEMP